MVVNYDAFQATGDYDYSAIDYWPNEGSDYMDMAFIDSSRSDWTQENRMQGDVVRVELEVLAIVLVLLHYLMFM